MEPRPYWMVRLLSDCLRGTYPADSGHREVVWSIGLVNWGELWLNSHKTSGGSGVGRYGEADVLW